MNASCWVLQATAEWETSSETSFTTHRSARLQTDLSTHWAVTSSAWDKVSATWLCYYCKMCFYWVLSWPIVLFYLHICAFLLNIFVCQKCLVNYFALLILCECENARELAGMISVIVTVYSRLHCWHCLLYFLNYVLGCTKFLFLKCGISRSDRSESLLDLLVYHHWLEILCLDYPWIFGPWFCTCLWSADYIIILIKVHVIVIINNKSTSFY